MFISMGMTHLFSCYPAGEQGKVLKTMKKNTIVRAARLVALALGLIGPSLHAQQTAGLQASFGGDVATLSGKFSGLAKVLDEV